MASQTYDPRTLTLTFTQKQPREVVEVKPDGTVHVEPVYGPAPWPAHFVGVDYGGGADYSVVSVVVEHTIRRRAIEQTVPRLPRGERG